MIELLNIDCRDYLSCCKDKQFDLAIVDPPYEDNCLSMRNFNQDFSRNKAKVGKYKYDGLINNKPDIKYFNELIRISNNQIIWGGNYFIEFLKNTPCFIIWDKNNTGHFADAELAWTSFNTATRIFKYRWNGMLQENMKDKESRIHPTQKPVQLYKWLLKNYAKPTDKIIDTHLGSGSSAIACYDFGCDFVGCEIDKGYYKDACKRFENHKLQGKLF